MEKEEKEKYKENRKKRRWRRRRRTIIISFVAESLWIWPRRTPVTKIKDEVCGYLWACL